MCRKRKVNAGKSKVMVVVIKSEIQVDGVRLEHVSEFRYLGCVLDEAGTDGAKCSRKVANGRRVVGAIRSLVMLGFCSLSVLESCMKHSLYLLLRIAVRQCYRSRRRDLGLGLYR